MRYPTKLILFCLIVFCMSLLSGFAVAQIRESGTIHGNVSDEQKLALPGVTVKISGASLIGGVKTYITDVKGYYRFPSLPAGKYVVSAELSGFSKLVREGIDLHANMSLTVDFQMFQATITEKVLVIAESPTIDIKSSSSGGAVLNNDFLMDLPAQKNIVGTFLLSPGTDSEYESAFGSHRYESNYNVDGVDISGTMNGGTLFRPDYNIIEEAEFSGLGLPAEFGEFTGGLVNTITKSGSNRFTGLAEIVYNQKDWNSQNIAKYSLEEWTDPALAQKYQSGSLMDLSMQLGGRIIRDKLWFFIAGAKVSNKSYPTGVTGNIPDRYNKIFTKIHFQLNQSNRITAQVIYSKNRTDNYSLCVEVPEEITPYSSRPVKNFASSWTSVLSPNVILDAKFGYHKSQGNLLPHPGLENVTSGEDITTGYLIGNWPNFMKNNEERYQGIVHLSYYVPSFLIGSHDIKLGAEYQHSIYDNKTWSPGNFKYWLDDGEPLEAIYQEPVTKDYDYDTIALFAQDSLTIGKRLTINVGVRYNRYSFNLPVQGQGRVYNSGSLAPRIGFTYDILGDRKSVFKFHYGHYYSSLKAVFFRNIDDRGAEKIHYDWDGSNWVESYTEAPSTLGYSVDPNTRQPYQQEIVAAFERELFKNASIEFDVYFRKAMRFIGAVRMNGEYQLIDMLDKGPDGIAGTDDDTTFPFYNQTNYRDTAVYVITNPISGMSTSMVDDPKRTAKGLDVIFSKKMSNHWQLMVSYNYSKTHGNAYDMNLSTLGLNPNNFTNAYGPQTFWGEPHHLKIQGSVILPLDINLGIMASFSSGKGEYAQASYRTAAGLVSVRRKATGDAWLYDGQKNLDLRIEKRFSLGQGRMMTLMANVFNVFNDGRVTVRHQTYGSLYGKIREVEIPRTFNLSARFWF